MRLLLIAVAICVMGQVRSGTVTCNCNNPCPCPCGTTTSPDATCPTSGPTVNHTHDEEFIGFSVGTRDSFTSSTTARIPMEVVFYNAGGYFKADNTFHAPVKGVYSFTFSGTSAGTSDIYLYLYTQKPREPKVHVASSFDNQGGGSGSGGASGSVMVVMEVGETASVWLQSNDYLHGAGATWGPSTLFSGKLEKKL